MALLMRVTGRTPPSKTELSSACFQVSEWAYGAGYPTTALLFAEASAVVDPKKPYASFYAARAHRIGGEAWRAEAYYLRAVRLAYRSQEWGVYVRGNLGAGRLLLQQARYREAERHYYSAARVAFDQGEVWLAAQIFHDLLALSLEKVLFLGPSPSEQKSALADAERYAHQMLTRYPRHHERFPAAVHDYAFLLICQNRYADAFPFLGLLLQAPIPAHDQVIGWSSFARTAGELGDRSSYSLGEKHVLESVEEHRLHAASALVNLGFGARALGDWDRAEVHTRTGIELAEQSGHRLAAHVGRALLDEILAGVAAAPLVPRATGPVAVSLRELAERLADQLTSWRGRTWTRKYEQHGPDTLGLV